MQRRLMRYHAIEDAKKYYDPPDYVIQDIEEDPDYADLYQLYQLPDYREHDVDCDFQRYLPRCLLKYGKPVCCHEYYGDLSYLDSIDWTTF